MVHNVYLYIITMSVCKISMPNFKEAGHSFHFTHFSVLIKITNTLDYPFMANVEFTFFMFHVHLRILIF